MQITEAPFIPPEQQPGDADFPIYARLLGYACASGERELESALVGMRACGLQVQTKPDGGGYRIGAAEEDAGWRALRDRFLRPYAGVLAVWLKLMWQQDHPTPEESAGPPLPPATAASDAAPEKPKGCTCLTTEHSPHNPNCPLTRAGVLS